jgi:hypothetical protein
MREYETRKFAELLFFFFKALGAPWIGGALILVFGSVVPLQAVPGHAIGASAN